MIGLLPYFISQHWRIIRMIGKESIDLCPRLRRCMSGQQRSYPGCREEYIAGPLHLLHRLQSRTNIFYRPFLSQPVIQICQCGRRPGFYPTVLCNQQRSEDTVTHLFMGRNRRRDKLILPFPVRICYTRKLGINNFVCLFRQMKGQYIR